MGNTFTIYTKEQKEQVANLVGMHYFRSIPDIITISRHWNDIPLTETEQNELLIKINKGNVQPEFISMNGCHSSMFYYRIGAISIFCNLPIK